MKLLSLSLCLEVIKMKNKSLIIILITLLITLCIGLIIFMIGMINGSFHMPNLFHITTSNQLIIDETYPSIAQITIDETASDIHIYSTDKKQCRVVVYGDKDYTNIDMKNKQLSIISKPKQSFFFNNSSDKIDIYLPKDYKDKINITNNYGDIKIENFKYSQLDIDNDFGDISIEEASQAKIKESTGDINIGNIKNINVENNFGDTEIENITGELVIEADCGNINIDRININKNSKIKCDLGDVKIHSTNEIYIDAKVDLGDVHINNNYRHSNTTLNIEVDSGDITIKN